MRNAWVNWNPDPVVHAYGTTIGKRGVVIAMCRVLVRECRGDFDPSDPKACPTCADDVLNDRTWDDVKDRRIEHGPNVFVCRRPA